MKQILKSISITSIAIVVLLVLSPLSVVNAAETMVMKYPAATVTLHSDGSFTPDTYTLLETFNVPEDILFSSNPEYRAELPAKLQDAGFHEVYFDQTKQSWRVSFTTIVEAPLIDIWKDEAKKDGGLSLDKSESDLKSGTTETARSGEAMGLSFFYGSPSYLLENDTDDSAASWNYTTDFLVDTYEILFLDEIGDYNSNNLTITVSYVENLSYENLNSTYAYNLTIFNEPVDGWDDYWFRLDLENTNTSFDEYVANIHFQNFDVTGGRYVLGVDANTTDSRYDTNYIGSLSTSLSLSAEQHFRKKIGPSLETHNRGADGGLKLSGWFDDITSGDILDIPSDFSDLAPDVINEARGWKSASDLEDSIMQSIIDKSSTDKINDITDINDLTLSSSIMNWAMPKALTDPLNDIVNKAADKYDDVKSLYDSVRLEAVPRVQFATDVTAPEIQETGGVTSNEVTDATNGVVAAEKDGSSNFGKGVVDWITDAAGAIGDGAISVWTTLEKAGEDIGLGSLLPYLIVAAMAIGIFILFRYIMM